ncbi:MAG: ABC transporter substrate-binding protein, partial [Spirochaetes bacterium]|nr:ABC transporter substrate-binding protein [Spirochaetota bacterium]
FTNLFSQHVDDLVYYTESYPPLNYQERGNLKGISVDILDEILKLVNSKYSKKDIQLVPWARGYNYLLENKNTCLFTTTRTKNRESLFNWVGPITDANIVLIAKKSKKVKINNPEDITKFYSIAVFKDVGEQFLLSNGVPRLKIRSTVSGENAMRMLIADRGEVWAYGKVVAFWLIKNEGYNPNDFEVVYTLNRSAYYYAFHKDTDLSIITELQTALNSLVKAGRVQQIIDQKKKKK